MSAECQLGLSAVRQLSLSAERQLGLSADIKVDSGAARHKPIFGSLYQPFIQLVKANIYATGQSKHSLKR